MPDIPSDPPIVADNDAISLRVGRRGLALFLFQVLRSRDAGAAVVDAGTLRLARGSRNTEIPLGNIQSVDLNAGRKWARLRLRHTTGAAVVSGLPLEDARAFVQTLERARLDWWRRTLASRIETLRRVSDRLVEFADPQSYLTRSAFAELVRDAEDEAGHFVAGWPDTLSRTPEADYMARTVLSRNALGRLMANVAAGIIYPNFKNAARGDAYHGHLTRVWHDAVTRLQDRRSD